MVTGPARTSTRWIVRAGDGRTVRDVLARAQVDADAVTDGRVFVGRRRVLQPGEPIREGDVVEIAPPRATLPDVPVLALTEDLVAVDKPAGIATIADHAGSAGTLLSLVARKIDRAAANIHTTSRLDRDVSGVVVVALTKAAARRLAAARAQGNYQRRYLAIASRSPNPNYGA